MALTLTVTEHSYSRSNLISTTLEITAKSYLKFKRLKNTKYNLRFIYSQLPWRTLIPRRKLIRICSISLWSKTLIIKRSHSLWQVHNEHGCYTFWKVSNKRKQDKDSHSWAEQRWKHNDTFKASTRNNKRIRKSYCDCWNLNHWSQHV